MSQKVSKHCALICVALVLAGCQYNPFRTQSGPANGEAAMAVDCPAECQAETTKPKQREYVERESTSTGLQLGAFAQPSGATSLIQRLSRNYPVVFDRRTAIIRAIERDGATLYRVILGPFSDTAVAQAFCELLRENAEACFTTAFDRVDLRVDRVGDT